MVTALPPAPLLTVSDPPPTVPPFITALPEALLPPLFKTLLPLSTSEPPLFSEPFGDPMVESDPLMEIVPPVADLPIQLPAGRREAYPADPAARAVCVDCFGQF